MLYSLIIGNNRRNIDELEHKYILINSSKTYGTNYAYRLFFNSKIKINRILQRRYWQTVKAYYS